MSPMALRIFAALVLIGISHQCGMITHNEITQRGLFSFKHYNASNVSYDQIFKDNMAYLEPASVYPDWGYLCKSPAGEASHWPPFITAFANYLKETYKPNTKEYNELLTFLMGVASHDEADVIWHWGPNDYVEQEGFLHSMSHDSSDCKDSWNSGTDPTCHTIGDTGADLYLAHRGDLNWMKLLWYVPSKDLEQIYLKIGLNVSSLEITGCMALMYAGAHLEKIGGGIAFSLYGKHSAFLSEELDLWFSGGLDDMAANVMWKWNLLIDYLEGRVNTTVKSLEDAIRQSFKKVSFPLLMNFGIENYQKYIDLLGIQQTETERGHTLSFNETTYNANLNKTKELFKQDISAQYLKLAENSSCTSKEALQADVKEFMNSSKNYSQLPPLLGNSRYSIDSTIKSNYPYTYFGKSFASGDFNGDGKKEIFIGAPGFSTKGGPQTGAVYYSDNTEDFTHFDENPYIIGTSNFSRFGFSLAATDINRDGVDDLIVSAPTFGSGKPTVLDDYYPKKYNGRVFIYYGVKGIGIQKNATPDVEILQQIRLIFL